MSTRTDYSVAGGGGKGYINIGGWNTTLTDRSTSQKEVPGTKRREGANLYIYAFQGSSSAAASGYFVQITTPLADADGLTSPVVFTVIGAGTANPNLWKGITLTTADTSTYGWYMVEGICTCGIGTNTTSATVELPICIAPSSLNTVYPCTASGQGFALTTISCATAGQCFIKLM